MAKIKFKSMNTFTKDGEPTGLLYDREAYTLTHVNSAETLHETLGSLPYASMPVDPRSALNHVRDTFSLCQPVLNYILAGSNGARIYKLLGLTKKEMEYVCQFKSVYDMELRKLVSIDWAIDNHRVDILAGGVYLNHVIDNLNLLADITAVINCAATKVLNNSDEDFVSLLDSVHYEVEERKNGIKYQAALQFIHSPGNAGTGFFCPGLKFEATGKEDATALAPFFDAIAEVIDKECNHFAYLSHLINMDLSAAHNKLRELFFYNMIIPPAKMRPRFGTRSFDQMENSFVEVYLANNNLSYSLNITEDTLKDYINAYRNLWNKVTALTYKHKKVNRVALLERFKGKKGALRGGNLAKRMDYSGRSVIIVDPTLSLDTVRIPKSSARNIYKLMAIKKGNYTIRNVCRNHGGWDPTCRTVDKSPEFFKGNEAPRVVIGRQPTLHKGSITSYKVRTTDGNAIMLSPLICPAFNADFDGDTMWDTIPLEEDAQIEAATLLFGPNNMFWAKDGNPTISPRQEIIYGLNQCTLSSHVNNTSNAIDYNGYKRRQGVFRKFIHSLEDAYKAVIQSKARIYDYATVPGYNRVLVGRLAFLHCIEGSNIEFNLNHFEDVDCVCPTCAYTQTFREFDGAQPHYCAYCKGTEMVRLTSAHGYKCPCCGISFDPWGAYKHVKDVQTESANESAEKRKKRLEELNSLTLLEKKAFECVKKLDGYSDYTAAKSQYELLQREANAIRRIVQAIRNALAADESFLPSIQKLIKLDPEKLKNVAPTLIDAHTPIDKRDVIEAANTNADVASALYKYYKEFPDKYTIIQTIAGSEPSILKEGSGLLSYYQSILEGMVKAAKAFVTVYLSHSSIFDILTDISTECHKCSYGARGATITNKNINFFVKRLLVASGECTNFNDNALFVKCIDKMVALGFAVAKQYAPTLNVLHDINFDDEFAKFRSEIESVKTHYDFGYVSDDEYNEKYTKALAKLEKSISGDLEKRLTDNNGFLKMVQSGARGSTKNLMQIYGYKGQVQKNSTESFNAIIEHSYVQQLSPVEGFMAAYGSRRGIMDRSLVTADTGYVSRQLWHACQGAIIVSRDCGATEDDTIIIDHNTLSSVISGKTDTIDNVLIDYYRGRYGFIDGKEELITAQRAKELVQSRATVKLRSPFTCKDPFCVKCYGIDMSTWNEVVVGTPVGIVAAEAIGETTSQLTMRTFQGGGVAGKGGIGSAFDKTKMYIGVSDVYANSEDTYEPVAWEDGEVLVEDGTVCIMVPNKTVSYTSASQSELLRSLVGLKNSVTKGEDMCEPACGIEAWGTGDIIVGDNGKVGISSTVYKKTKCPNKSWVVDAAAPLKTKVKRGEGLYTTPGDKDMNELLTYGGLKTAQIYTALKLHSIYKSECLISLKHFEILVASMTRGKVLRTNNPYLNIGCYYTAKELKKFGITPDTVIQWEFKPVVSIPGTECDCLANIDFEDPAAGLFDSIMLDRQCDFTNPIESLVFGFKPQVGAAINPNYIYERTGSNRVPSSGKSYHAPRGDMLL